LRILLAHKFFYRKGGAEVVMLQEREFLLEHGVEVVDFSMVDPRNQPSPYSGYFVSHRSFRDEGKGLADKLRLAVNMVHSPEAVHKMGRLIDATRPDLVHCHNIYHQLTPSIIGAAKKRGLPVVLTLHDYKPICPVYTRLRAGQPCSRCQDGDFVNVLRYRCADGSLGGSAVLLAEAWIQRLRSSYEQVDLVVAPSEFMRRSVAGHRFSAEKVTVLYNGVDTARIVPAAGDRGYVLYLGRLSSEKGVQTLLEVHAAASPPFRLVVAGSGPLERDLRSQYASAEYVNHLGGTELDEVIRGAAVIVVPSEWYENCPMSVLEAMAYGKPVVGADIGGIPELIADGQTGLLFTPGDREGLNTAIRRLMEDPALRHRLGCAAREKIEECFSLDRHHTGLLALYGELLGHTSGPVGAAGRPSASAVTQL